MDELRALIAEAALAHGGAQAAQILDGDVILVMPFGRFVVSFDRIS